VAKHAAETTEDMTTVASWIGLAINASKTKIIIQRNKKDNAPETTERNRKKYKNTEIFKHTYLPSVNIHI